MVKTLMVALVSAMMLCMSLSSASANSMRVKRDCRKIAATKAVESFAKKVADIKAKRPRQLAGSVEELSVANQAAAMPDVYVEDVYPGEDENGRQAARTSFWVSGDGVQKVILYVFSQKTQKWAAVYAASFASKDYSSADGDMPQVEYGKYIDFDKSLDFYAAGTYNLCFRIVIKGKTVNVYKNVEVPEYGFYIDNISQAENGVDGVIRYAVYKFFGSEDIVGAWTSVSIGSEYLYSGQLRLDDWGNTVLDAPIDRGLLKNVANIGMIMTYVSINATDEPIYLQRDQYYYSPYSEDYDY